MFMPPSLFKTLALPIVAIILALTPMSSLVSWVEGGSETVYSGPSYTVIYKPNLLNTLTRSNETRVIVEVQDESGRPVGFTALLSGPASRGAVEVGNVSGKGYGVKGIGKYVSEVKRVLRELNSDPERSGLGMLILLSTIIEEAGEYYAAADAISVPIIPGKAVGKDVIVKVTFKPIMKYKVRGENTSTRHYEEQSATTPPSRITDYCVLIGPNYSYFCYYWRLEEVIYESSKYEYVPVAITFLDSKTGNTAGFIIEELEIILTRGSVEYVSFDLSLGFNLNDKISFVAPGPGYTYKIGGSINTETIYRATCEIHSTSSPYGSVCRRLWGTPGRPWENFTVSKFTGDVLVSLGFRGKMWLLRYAYVYERPGYIEVVNDKVVALWLAPTFNDYGKIWAWWEVDDYPNDSRGAAEKLLKNLESSNAIAYQLIDFDKFREYSLLIRTIYDHSRASQWFGIGIPIGALILAIGGVSLPVALAAIVTSLAVGIEAGSVTVKIYEGYNYFRVSFFTYDYTGIYYAKFTNTYVIKEEDNAEKVVPLMVFKPERY